MDVFYAFVKKKSARALGMDLTLITTPDQIWKSNLREADYVILPVTTGSNSRIESTPDFRKYITDRRYKTLMVSTGN